MFRNLRLYRLPNGISATPDQLDEQLQSGAFKPCEPGSPISMGWVEPKEGMGLVVSNDKQRLLCFQVEEKILPSSYIARCAQGRVAEIEENEGRRVGRKEMREIREGIAQELMPRAFTRLSRSFVWIDNANGWMALEGTASRCDDIMSRLRMCLAMIPHIVLPRTNIHPGTAMTSWLAGGEAPMGLTIDHDCELRSAENAMVRYIRHAMDGSEIRNHIMAGKVVSKLGMTCNDSVSFVLTESMEIKRIEVLDIIKEQAETQAENDEERFMADFIIYSGELAKVISTIVEACGGLEPDIDGGAA